ncbi:pyrroline-5-carboxylate reductase [Methyloceanibacter superfactus]|uniref:Pyrroline-5-carboxylate reductase n=1 Tax=Methyloceanibacter superfactus TaxID=1774969 RepID=A0A1E3W1B6_9HYPH|nr:pyrroline-5-carboxylate reductase [Methyloceanibacter superfactus]ODR99580.1 pyrroline-5-carboxylate reductase [Methyloceanibacter superfactus]
MTLRLAGPLLLVGAGKMGGALLEGWLQQGLDPATVSFKTPRCRTRWQHSPQRTASWQAMRPSYRRRPAVILIAVKPDVAEKLLPEVEPMVGDETVVLSIAAGRTLQSLSRYLPETVAVVRAMPNTPASVGQGMTVAIANANVTQQQKNECDALMSAVGEVIWVEDEALLDPVTAVSGSGPAYVFLLAECLEEAGIAAGLPHELAERLARATVAGAGELLRRSDLEPAQLRKNVTSPKGTTAAALDVLMGEDALKDLLTQAVAAAAKRSRELSS